MRSVTGAAFQIGIHVKEEKDRRKANSFMALYTIRP